jgi:formylglycine-generating enzyme required for sulfatase activity
MAGKIFISYRRSETAWAARALFERLWREFPERVFIDIEGLSLGTKFNEVIDAHLEGCEVMLALIGHSWLAELQKRLEDEDEPDWVRAELARGLGRGIPVVPVLIDGAVIPAKRDLPGDLKAVRDHHGLELHARYFDDQAGRLVRQVRKMLSRVDVAEVVAAKVETPPAQPAPLVDGALSNPAAAFPAVIRKSWAEPWMSREGEDQYGRWADIQANGETQRLRWIPPGHFRMGSPPGEEGRDEDEGPQHEVTLTRGFWLADTACTQALWQAVVGNSPSRFTGDLQRPVEQVDWAEVTAGFLPNLSGLFGGRVEAVLPTEAEWEYACRAGTTTAFSFGDDFDPARAHVAAKQTVPVKALPPNPWGLYQMHGNVCEWCADSRRTYGMSPMVNPDGGQEVSCRTLRGGSWSSGALGVRSAARICQHIDDRVANFGFRFALKSIEAGAVVR